MSCWKSIITFIMYNTKEGICFIKLVPVKVQHPLGVLYCLLIFLVCKGMWAGTFFHNNAFTGIIPQVIYIYIYIYIYFQFDPSVKKSILATEDKCVTNPKPVPTKSAKSKPRQSDDPRPGPSNLGARDTQASSAVVESGCSIQVGVLWSITTVLNRCRYWKCFAEHNWFYAADHWKKKKLMLLNVSDFHENYKTVWS